MAYGARNSLLSWWIIIVLVAFFWYRNNKYDRIIAAIAFVLGMIQLVEYGLFNNMNRNQGSRLLNMLIWLFLFILSLSILIYTKEIYSLIWALIISVVFMAVCFYSFTHNENFDVEIVGGNHIKNTIIDEITVIYLILFFVTVSLLFWFEGANMYNSTLFLYPLISMIAISLLYESFFLSLWVYSLLGMLFILWFIGMFQ